MTMRRPMVARKIVAVILQPVYDAEGKLLYQPGTELAEDHKILKSIPADTYRHVVVEDDKGAAPEPKPKSESKADAKAESGKASSSFSVSKGSVG
jgi:hypothetical protein